MRDCGRSVVPAVGGLVLGYAGMTVIVAVGVGALVAENPKALTALTVLGGGYLMWHGARTLASPSAPVTTTTAAEGRLGGASTRLNPDLRGNTVHGWALHLCTQAE
ncbi:hypothetical protein Airi01_021510 [Actinoallomurus iriomotensis]|uniref:Uncharacterized protein n=1 Tax=Actinoallomurus iriomotensis TaxID=478107 RepID=A0A9W6VNL2_9ACTN|nr:hypothetical protein Airi01_021510 [Actinoallomurus iriomotensis]